VWKGDVTEEKLAIGAARTTIESEGYTGFSDFGMLVLLSGSENEGPG
jgi:hypothetical protein